MVSSSAPSTSEFLAHNGTLMDAQTPARSSEATWFVHTAGVALLQVFACYYIIAGLLHYVWPAIHQTRSIQLAKKQKTADTYRDVVRSIVPLIIKSSTLVLAETLHRNGYGRLTNESIWTKLSTLNGVLEITIYVIALDIFHDTWFYWSHRSLHSSWMMRRVHYMHHQSSVPSAFTAYSFHWIEAVIVFSVALAEMFIIPIPRTMHRFYEIWMIIIHIGGHCGYEIAPFIPHALAALLGPLFWVCGHSKVLNLTMNSVINNVEHHDMHHRHPKYHFSLYYTHWDYLGGSMHPDYVKKNPRAL